MHYTLDCYYASCFELGIVQKRADAATTLYCHCVANFPKNGCIYF
jgi:hypothetical protein